MVKKRPNTETRKPMATKMPRLFKRFERVATDTDTIPETMRTGELRRLDFMLLQPKVDRMEGWKTVTEYAEVHTAKYICQLVRELNILGGADSQRLSQ